MAERIMALDKYLRKIGVDLTWPSIERDTSTGPVGNGDRDRGEDRCSQAPTFALAHA